MPCIGLFLFLMFKKENSLQRVICFCREIDTTSINSPLTVHQKLYDVYVEIGSIVVFAKLIGKNPQT